MKYLFITITIFVFNFNIISQCLSGNYNVGNTGDFIDLKSFETSYKTNGVCGDIKLIITNNLTIEDSLVFETGFENYSITLKCIDESKIIINESKSKNIIHFGTAKEIIINEINLEFHTQHFNNQQVLFDIDTVSNFIVDKFNKKETGSSSNLFKINAVLDTFSFVNSDLRNSGNTICEIGLLNGETQITNNSFLDCYNLFSINTNSSNFFFNMNEINNSFRVISISNTEKEGLDYKFTKNKIYNNDGNIEIQSDNSDKALIINNFLSRSFLKFKNFKEVKIFHNTIANILLGTLGADSTIQRNNLFLLSENGFHGEESPYTLRLPTSNKLNSDYNNYYTELIGQQETVIIPNEPNSTFYKFSLLENYKTDPTSYQVLKSGVFIPEVFDDIEGNVRDSLSAIGCHNFEPAQNAALFVDKEPYSGYEPICPGSLPLKVRVGNFSDTVTSIHFKVFLEDSLVGEKDFNGFLLQGEDTLIQVYEHETLETSQYRFRVLIDSVNHTDPYKRDEIYFFYNTHLNSGEYSVGSKSSDFFDMQELFDLIAEFGICGNLTVNVEKGEYYGDYTIDHNENCTSDFNRTCHFSTSSPTDTLLIQSADGNPHSAKFRPSSRLDRDNRYSLKVRGPNLKFKNLSFINNANHHFPGLVTNANNLSIDNCIFERGTNRYEDRLESESGMLDFFYCSNVEITNSSFINGDVAIHASNTDTVTINNSSFEGINVNAIYGTRIDYFHAKRLNIDMNPNAYIDGFILFNQRAPLYFNQGNAIDFKLEESYIWANTNRPILGGLSVGSKISIINNKLFSKGGGIVSFERLDTLKFLHNTVVAYDSDEGQYNFWAFGRAQEFDYRNNLILTNSDKYIPESTASYNILFNNNFVKKFDETKTSFNSFKNQYLIENEYYAQITNQGDSTVKDLVKKDYLGALRDSLPDIGAIESNFGFIDLQLAYVNNIEDECHGSPYTKIIVYNNSESNIEKIQTTVNINGQKFYKELNVSIESYSYSDTLTIASYLFDYNTPYIIDVSVNYPNDTILSNNHLTSEPKFVRLGGEYSVGGNTNSDFEHLSDALDALSNMGICRSVQLNLATGVQVLEDGEIGFEIDQIQGVSEGSFLTLNGNGKDSTIITSNEDHPAFPSNRERSLLHINSDNVIIQNLGIMYGGYYPWSVGFVDDYTSLTISDVSNVLIDNVSVYGSVLSNNSNNLEIRETNFSGSGSPHEIGDNAPPRTTILSTTNQLVFYNNGDDIRLIDNTFKDYLLTTRRQINLNGNYEFWNGDLFIKGNTFSNCYLLFLQAPSAKLTIQNNEFLNSTTSKTNLQILNDNTDLSNFDSNPVDISNNLFDASIILKTPFQPCKVYHNTISNIHNNFGINGNSNYPSLFISTKDTVINNLFYVIESQNYSSNSTGNYFIIDKLATNFNSFETPYSDNNLFLSYDSHENVFNQLNQDFEVWKLNGDVNSSLIKKTFSFKDEHLRNLRLEDNELPSALYTNTKKLGLQKDIDGHFRSLSHPFFGASEPKMATDSLHEFIQILPEKNILCTYDSIIVRFNKELLEEDTIYYSVNDQTSSFWTYEDLNSRKEVYLYASSLKTSTINLRVWSNSVGGDYFSEVGESYELSNTSIKLNNDAPFCSGNNTLSILNSEDFLSYKWSTGDTTESLILNDTSSNQELILETESIDHCLSVDTIKIRYKTLELTFKDSIVKNCESNRTLLELNYDKNSLEYHWFNEERLVSTTHTPKTTVYNNSGNYSAALLEDGCLFQSNSIDVLLFHTPQIPRLVEENDSILYLAVGKETTYEWSFNDNSILDSDTNFVIKTKEGTYRLNIIYENGCSRTLHLKPLGLGSSTNYNNHLLELYPNPTTNFIQLGDGISSKTVTILNMLGTSITKPVNLNNKIDVRDLKTGTYIILLESNNINYASKFIIE